MWSVNQRFAVQCYFDWVVLRANFRVCCTRQVSVTDYGGKLDGIVIGTNALSASEDTLYANATMCSCFEVVGVRRRVKFVVLPEDAI